MPTLTTRSIETARAIADRRAFKTYGSLYAKRYSHVGFDTPTYHVGYLPHEYREAYDQQRKNIDYVVFSYDTPIAWHSVEEGWTVPPVKYSRTTSKHQSNLYMIKEN